MRKSAIFTLFVLATAIFAFSCTKAEKQTGITPEEARAIAREAYTYGFPHVETYKSLYKQAVDKTNSDFKAPINKIGHAEGVATPDDAGFITPNTDTPYSFLWADLRTEPIVITMPKIEKKRYYLPYKV